MSVSTWYCETSGKILDGYEVEFTGENINCVATTTTSSTGKPAEVTPISRSENLSGACSPKVWTKSRILHGELKEQHKAAFLFKI